MSIEQMITDLKGGNNVAAGRNFNSVMADKLTAALDAKKIEVASTLQDRAQSQEEK
jgi:hypothetical protein